MSPFVKSDLNLFTASCRNARHHCTGTESYSCQADGEPLKCAGLEPFDCKGKVGTVKCAKGGVYEKCDDILHNNNVKGLHVYTKTGRHYHCQHASDTPVCPDIEFDCGQTSTMDFSVYCPTGLGTFDNTAIRCLSSQKTGKQKCSGITMSCKGKHVGRSYPCPGVWYKETAGTSKYSIHPGGFVWCSKPNEVRTCPGPIISLTTATTNQQLKCPGATETLKTAAQVVEHVTCSHMWDCSLPMDKQHPVHPSPYLKTGTQGLLCASFAQSVMIRAPFDGVSYSINVKEYFDSHHKTQWKHMFAKPQEAIARSGFDSRGYKGVIYFMSQREPYKLASFNAFTQEIDFEFIDSTLLAYSCGSIVPSNGHLFISGGLQDGIPSKSVQLLDIETKSWLALPGNMKVGRAHHCCTVCNNEYYVIGGSNLHSSSRYDGSEFVPFMNLPLSPDGRGCVALTLQEKKDVFVVQNGDAVYLVNVRTKKVITNNMPDSRLRPCVVEAAGRVLVIGGSSQAQLDKNEDKIMESKIRVHEDESTKAVKNIGENTIERKAKKESEGKTEKKENELSETGIIVVVAIVCGTFALLCLCWMAKSKVVVNAKTQTKKKKTKKVKKGRAVASSSDDVYSDV